MNYKSGFIAVVGRPNVGKSTLLNRVLGEKILIVSDKPQTTRNKIRCIYTEDNLQAVFLDTPGVHKPHHRLGEQLVTAALTALAEVDQVWLVVEPTKNIDPAEIEIISRLPQGAIVVLVVNKCDTATPEARDIALARFGELYPFKACFAVSAITGEGVEALLAQMRATLPPGPQYYPEDMIIDQPERFVAGEIIREKVLDHTRDEVPHSTAVVVEAMKEQGDIVHVDANIYVERDSQKGILIGKSGAMLKAIGVAARKDIEGLLGSQIHLTLWVKVRKNWRKNEQDLRHLGYRQER